LYDNPELPLPRAAVQFQWSDPDAINNLKARVGSGTDMLKIGPIKVFADGGFTGPAAYTLEPYVNQGEYRGYLNMPESELVALLNEIHDAGWQMGIHAIGDAAIVLVVNTLADTLERNPRADHRHYLNHFSMRPPELTMELMAEHAIHITQQPNFTYTLEGRYVENLDGWRLQHNNPIRSPMDHGITVAISSDILPIGPLVGLYAAVTRKGMTGSVYGPDEAISMAEAIRGYTLLGAYLNFEEDTKGSLEPGKFADMIVLSDDLLTIDPEQIMDVLIEQTFVHGKLVYSND
jgi:predicted amidohydrolase YtcJ